MFNLIKDVFFLTENLVLMQSILLVFMLMVTLFIYTIFI
jgi:hypothetical protein